MGMLDGTPVGPVAVPVPALTDEATIIESGSHDVAVLVPVGMIDWGAGVVGVTVARLIEGVVESVEREVGLVRGTVPLEEAVKPVVVNGVGLVRVAFEETVAGPVELIDVAVVGKAVAVVLVEVVIGGVVVSVPKILERMLPRPVEDADADEDDTETVGMIPPRIEESTFPPPVLVEVMVGSDEEEVVDPVGSTVGRVKAGSVKVGTVRLSPSRPPPLEDEVVIVASSALVVVVVVVVVVDAPEDVPGPNNPLKRSLKRLSSLEVVGVGVVVVVVVVVSEVTTPPGPKVMAELWVELWLALVVDSELDSVVESVVELVVEDVVEDVGWMTVGMIPPEPVGLSRSDRTSVPPNGNPNKPLNPSRGRLGEIGLAGVALLTTRLIWRGK